MTSCAGQRKEDRDQEQLANHANQSMRRGQPAAQIKRAATRIKRPQHHRQGIKLHQADLQRTHQRADRGRHRCRSGPPGRPRSSDRTRNRAAARIRERPDDQAVIELVEIELVVRKLVGERTARPAAGSPAPATGPRARSQPASPASRVDAAQESRDPADPLSRCKSATHCGSVSRRRLQVEQPPQESACVRSPRYRYTASKMPASDDRAEAGDREVEFGGARRRMPASEERASGSRPESFPSCGQVDRSPDQDRADRQDHERHRHHRRRLVGVMARLGAESSPGPRRSGSRRGTCRTRSGPR